MGHNATEENRKSKSKILIYAILLFQLAVIGSLIRGIQLSKKSQERVMALRVAKDKLLAENAVLKDKVEFVKSDYYVEKVAREELQKAKPGEKVVILPESQQIREERQELHIVEEKRLHNWEKWWRLLVE